MSLKHKHIVITGASGGIGAKMAELCAEQGARLVLLARTVSKLEQMKADWEAEYGAAISVFALDVSDTDQVQAVFEQIHKEIGHVDILVNNAGFGVFRHAHEVPMDEVKSMFAVNVFGLISCTNAVLPGMRARRSGHIVNIASQAGKIATPKSSVYSATKHAVLGFTNSLRMELADAGIHVTAVNPGPIATDFFTTADTEGTYVKNVQRYMLKPDYVAQRIVAAMDRPVREINLPGWMNLGSKIFALFPGLFEKAGKRAFNKK
ncbi:SDR family NAD(P)-dependent oxidoreductase [Cytobacillus gottheilii]|uniref:SDR family NAD(P)-dependent oxidoreductase n=1 Tax=Cytobacillus gottheilii TaxID=859144 RepID=UPI0009B95190|nr:SDR family oxidoreductase [Cytobacillus gottheilii]